MKKGTKSPDEIVIESESVVQPAEPKPKKRIGLGIMLTVLVLLIVGGAIALGYLWGKEDYQKSSSNSQSSSNIDNSSNDTGETKPQEVKSSYPVQLISEENEVKDVVSKIYDAVKEAIKPSASIYKIYDEESVIYKDKNMKVATNLDKSYGVASPGNFDMNVKLGDVVKVAIEELGFVHYDDVVSLSSDGYYINNEKQIICSGVINSAPFGVSCGKTSWISIDKKEFINNLAKATGDLNSAIIIADEANIINSSVSPYQTLTANVSNAAGLFYRNSPDSEWKLFATAQMIIPCDRYLEHPDAENVKKAFADQTCLVDNSGATAKIGELQ